MLNLTYLRVGASILASIALFPVWLLGYWSVFIRIHSDTPFYSRDSLWVVLGAMFLHGVLLGAWIFGVSHLVALAGAM